MRFTKLISGLKELRSGGRQSCLSAAGKVHHQRNHLRNREDDFLLRFDRGGVMKIPRAELRVPNGSEVRPVPASAQNHGNKKVRAPRGRVFMNYVIKHARMWGVSIAQTLLSTAPFRQYKGQRLLKRVQNGYINAARSSNDIQFRTPLKVPLRQ